MTIIKQTPSTRTPGQPHSADPALVQALQQCPLFFDLAAEELREVAGFCSLVTVAAQQHVFLEGERCVSLWVIAEGRVRLYHSDAQGRQQVVAFRGPYYALDLSSAIDGRAHSASAVALDDCRLVAIPRAALTGLGRRFPVTVRNTLDQLCLELRQRDIATSIASLRDARGRVQCTLLQMARQYGLRTAHGLLIDYRLTRQDIADRSGVTLETAIRVLSELQRVGVIRTRAQFIEIVDKAALTELARCEECELDCSVFNRSQPPATA